MKARNPDTHSNTDESKKHYGKWKKPDTHTHTHNNYILYHLLYIKFWKIQNYCEKKKDKWLPDMGGDRMQRNMTELFRVREIFNVMILMVVTSFYRFVKTSWIRLLKLVNFITYKLYPDNVDFLKSNKNLWMGWQVPRERRCWTENTKNIHHKYHLSMIKQSHVAGCAVLREGIALRVSEAVSHGCFIFENEVRKKLFPWRFLDIWWS